PRLQMWNEVHAQPLSALEKRFRAFFKEITGNLLTAIQSGDQVLRTDAGLAGAGRTHEKRTRSALQAPAQQGIQFRAAAGCEIGRMDRGTRAPGETRV